jgi:ectoine hydroxylase-related dioxygenase (phytanoyl-CoA dioxygenase family)
LGIFATLVARPYSRSESGKGLRALYHVQGYAVFRGLVPHAAIATLHDALQRDVYPSTQSFLRHPSIRREPNENYESPDGVRVIKNALLNAHLQSGVGNVADALLKLICRRELADQLRAIDGDDQHIIWQTILFFVSPRTNLHVDGWGSDTVPSGGQYTVWIPLEAITFDNGPVGVFAWPPGKGLTADEAGLTTGVADVGQAYSTYQDAVRRAVRERRLDCVVPLLDVGDVLIFSSATPHVSIPPSLNGLTRMALQVLVMPASTRCGGGLLSRGRGESWSDHPAALRALDSRWLVSQLAEH